MDFLFESIDISKQKEKKRLENLIRDWYSGTNKKSLNEEQWYLSINSIDTDFLQV